MQALASTTSGVSPGIAASQVRAPQLLAPYGRASWRPAKSSPAPATNGAPSQPDQPYVVKVGITAVTRRALTHRSVTRREAAQSNRSGFSTKTLHNPTQPFVAKVGNFRRVFLRCAP